MAEQLECCCRAHRTIGRSGQGACHRVLTFVSFQGGNARRRRGRSVSVALSGRSPHIIPKGRRSLWKRNGTRRKHLKRYTKGKGFSSSPILGMQVRLGCWLPSASRRWRRRVRVSPTRKGVWTVRSPSKKNLSTATN